MTQVPTKHLLQRKKRDLFENGDNNSRCRAANTMNDSNEVKVIDVTPTPPPSSSSAVITTPTAPRKGIHYIIMDDYKKLQFTKVKQ